MENLINVCQSGFGADEVRHANFTRNTSRQWAIVVAHAWSCKLLGQSNRLTTKLPIARTRSGSSLVVPKGASLSIGFKPKMSFARNVDPRGKSRRNSCDQKVRRSQNSRHPVQSTPVTTYRCFRCRVSFERKRTHLFAPLLFRCFFPPCFSAGTLVDRRLFPFVTASSGAA